jgi:hypothetical protein
VTLIAIRPLRFVDGILETGTRVQRLEPTDFERKDKGPKSYVGSLEEDVKNDFITTEPRAWVVVEWKGQRRRVPLRAFRVQP